MNNNEGDVHLCTKCYRIYSVDDENENLMIINVPDDTEKKYNNIKFKIYTIKHGYTIANDIRDYLFDMNIHSEVVSEIDPNDENKNELYYIVLFPQTLVKFPKYNKYIIYQLEQVKQSKWIDRRYEVAIMDSIKTFEYSTKNYENIIQDCKWHMTYLPMPISKTIIHNNNANDIDILFYGAYNNRRINILNCVMSKYNIVVIDDIFGEELYPFIKKAKIVINIHYYKNAILETARLNEILRFNKLIISESSCDSENISELYGNIIVFFDEIDDDLNNIDNLYKLLDYYLDNTNYDKHVNNQTKYIKKLYDNSKLYFERCLVSSGLISPRCMNFNVNSDEIYCISLDETLKTGYLPFISQEYLIKNIIKFPAIKHLYGWVGCGLSYKVLMLNAVSHNLNTITICEDDCLFPKDFDAKYSIIKEFLNIIDNWDIFVCAIADFHDETQISNIYKYKGLTFIEIDKFTSMIFNIYNKKVFNTITSWDETNHDVTSNTIDRTLSTKNLKIITIYPFTVGCLNVMSSLWHVKTDYSDMFTKSEKILESKINNFDKNKIIDFGI